jgi:hypothetical protein
MTALHFLRRLIMALDFTVEDVIHKVTAKLGLWFDDGRFLPVKAAVARRLRERRTNRRKFEKNHKASVLSWP